MTAEAEIGRRRAAWIIAYLGVFGIHSAARVHSSVTPNTVGIALAVHAEAGVVTVHASNDLVRARLDRELRLRVRAARRLPGNGRVTVRTSRGERAVSWVGAGVIVAAMAAHAVFGCLARGIALCVAARARDGRVLSVELEELIMVRKHRWLPAARAVTVRAARRERGVVRKRTGVVVRAVTTDTVLGSLARAIALRVAARARDGRVLDRKSVV